MARRNGAAGRSRAAEGLGELRVGKRGEGLGDLSLPDLVVVNHQPLEERLVPLAAQDLVTDLDLSLQRLTAITEEVADAVAGGNWDGAAMVLGTQRDKVGRFVDSWDALYEKVGGQEAGERAVNRGP